jgi:hypothetical protein
MRGLEHYKGVRNSMPEEGQRRFVITLSFFCGEGEARSAMTGAGGLSRWIESYDPELMGLIRAARPEMEEAKLRVYLGDPEEELEEALKGAEGQIGEWVGCLVLNRSAKLGSRDNLPQGDAEGDRLAGEFAPAAGVRRLLEYIETTYMDCAQLQGECMPIM